MKDSWGVIQGRCECLSRHLRYDWTDLWNGGWGGLWVGSWHCVNRNGVNMNWDASASHKHKPTGLLLVGKMSSRTLFVSVSWASRELDLGWLAWTGDDWKRSERSWAKATGKWGINSTTEILVYMRQIKWYNGQKSESEFGIITTEIMKNIIKWYYQGEEQVDDERRLAHFFRVHPVRALYNEERTSAYKPPDAVP